MYLRELTLATLILFEAGVVHAGFYGKSSAVISLDSKNFDREILQSDNAAVRYIPGLPKQQLLTRVAGCGVSFPSRRWATTTFQHS